MQTVARLNWRNMSLKHIEVGLSIELSHHVGAVVFLGKTLHSHSASLHPGVSGFAQS